MLLYVRGVIVLGLVALAMLFTGCSESPQRTDTVDLSRGDDSSPATEQAEGSDEPGAGESASTDAPDAIPSSYPEVGLEFSDLPQPRGTKREALEAYVAYERGLRKLSRTAKPNAMITDHATQPLITTMESTVDYLRSNSIRYQGTADIAVSFVGNSARATVLEVCIDGTDLELVQNGSTKPINGPGRLPGRVVVTSNGQAWLVTQYDTEEEQSC